MKELVRVTEQNGKQLVDARELHKSLESKKQFANWISNKVVNNPFFTKNADWVLLNNQSVIKSDNQQVNGRPSVEYALTLDTAKKVAMAEQTQRGNEVRKYFLEMEKKALNPMAIASTMNSEQLGLLLNETKQKEIAQEQVKALEPKADAYDVISNSDRLSSLDEVSKLYGTGRNRLYKWLKKHKYVKNNNVPYQKYVDAGYLDYRIDKVNKKLYYVTLFTGKGILFFKHKLEY